MALTVTRTQQERTEATRAALIASARRLFAQKGFAKTATTEIVTDAKITRGALYHHFTDKADLFRAVYEAVETEVVEAVWAAALSETRETPEQTALAHLRAGAEAFLDACLDPEVHRITLIDAPAVLGWDEWKRLDAHYGLGSIRTALQRAIDAGAIRPLPVEMLAHTVLGALTETALTLSRAQDSTRVRSEAMEVVQALIDGLRADYH